MRHTKNHTEKRGKISVTHTIHERPVEANNHSVIGHWEVDTVAGKKGEACLVTFTDSRSRYLMADKIEKKQSTFVRDSMIGLTVLGIKK